VPGLAAGALATAGPATAAPVQQVHPASAGVCATSSLDCTYVRGASVNVHSLTLSRWTRNGTGNIGYNAPGYPVKSKWRTHAFNHSNSFNTRFGYYWGGIHCSFPNGTHIYGWANWKVITRPYVVIEGSHFTDLHNCA
jgi:hypothetical protein